MFNLETSLKDFTQQRKYFCLMFSFIKMKRQPSEWEKICADEANNNELISKIYKQLMQLNIKKKTDNPIKIWVEDIAFLQRRYQFSLVQFSSSVMSNSLWPHESQHARPPCPSPTPRVYPNSCPSSQWCHPAISSSVVPFSSCPQSPPASGSFPMSQLFAWGSQSIGVSTSASVLPMNTHIDG